MKKPELRQKYKHLRAQLTPETIEDLSLKIANKLIKLPIWNFSTYHIFLSIIEQQEVNTDYILHILAGKDKNSIISKSNFNSNTLTHFLLTDNTLLKKNKYNIPEPTNGITISPGNIDVVFVPLLAFDKNGNRVGYGKGFYDRFLKQCKPNTVKVGLSFFEAETKTIPVNTTDIALNYCVTPSKVYHF